ncbi:unnamed protein product [Spirodela intermedia]|uniref:Uncharacterized protein n=1 Tax=Spirodela intermedia TaxID=51605 RepID=A0A7I8ID90_SPIIN|nr:unnamed protein product [Spirodela intermedia]CAA6655787.1 unnamed protein product [Spirodela intermedia]
MTKALSRKGSSRMERRAPRSKSLTMLVSSQLDQFKHPLAASRALATANSAASVPSLADSGEGKCRRFNRLTAVHPRKILLFFATMSSVGTMILIYCTLAINRRGES